MDNVTVRPVWSADHEALRRLGRTWLGRGPGKSLVVRTATLIGRVGKVALANDNKEAVVGFLLGTVDYPVVNLTWVATEPKGRLAVLQALVNSVRSEFPGFDLVIRVPNDEATKYEFLADLRDASGSKVTGDSSRAVKVTDENASYIYVRVRGNESHDLSSRRDRPAKVGRNPGPPPRPGRF